MKYALIADIHANLPALQTVLADITAQGCAQTLCLGDIVGYCSQPKECLDLIRQLKIPCVKGNHDEYCSSDAPFDQLGPALAEGIRWTREQLTAEDKRWLRELPYVLQISGFTLVHAALERPHLWMYVFDRLAAAASFLHQATPVCFFGHTHLAVAFERDTAVRGGTYSKMKIERGKKYFISVGSVGQPRDHDPRAAYAIYDLERETVELRRLNYPRPDPDEGAGKPAPVPPSPPGRSVASKNPLPRKPSAADD